MSNKNRNYDILDQILRDADIAERQSSGTWVADSRHPEGGYWVTNRETLEQLRRSTDAIEKYLRS